MAEARWIVVPRWDEFQHRDMARSTAPPWIKNMTKLFDNDVYLDLSQAQRGILHGLWLLYARHRRVLSETEARRMLVRSDAEARYWRGHLEALSHAGFIGFSASRPARYVPVLEVEVEKERELKTKPLKASVPSTSLALVQASSPPAVAEWRPVYDHWRKARGRTGTRYDRPLSKRTKLINDRLRRFSSAELMRAIDGIACDPWDERPQHDDLVVVFKSDVQVEKFLELEAHPPRLNGRFVSAQELMNEANRLAKEEAR